MKICTTFAKGLPTLAVAAFCCTSVSGQTCSETLLHDNGFPNCVNAIVSQNGDPASAQSADDFTLAADSVINDIHWYTTEENVIGVEEFVWDGTVLVEFYEEIGTCLPDPSTLLFSQIVPTGGGVVTRTVLGPSCGGAPNDLQVRYDVADINVALPAGTYWISLAPGSPVGTTGQTFWWATRMTSQGDVLVGCEGALIGPDFGVFVWTPIGALIGDSMDLNFQLTTCVFGGGPCPADIDGPGGAPDGVVDTLDLLLVLAQWGTPGPQADITGPAGTPDGIVDVLDLLMVIAMWGNCPPGGLPNDNCGDATLVFDGVYNFNNCGATTDGLPDPACLFFGNDQIFNDIWYCYKAECDGEVTVSLCGSTYDTKLAVYDTCADPAGPIIACNDDFCGLQSELTFTAIAGEHYKIRVGSFSDTGCGDGTLTITCNPGVVCNNTDCTLATDILPGSSVICDTTGAPIGTPPDCGFGPQSAGGLWYHVTGTGNTITATTCSVNTLYDTKMYVYCNSCTALICVGGNDDDPTCPQFLQSTVSWCSVLGDDYWILVHGFGTAEGQFELTVSDDGIPCSTPPDCAIVCVPGAGVPNDCCVDNIAIFDGVTPFSTVGANTDGPADPSCPFDGQTYHDIWYNYTATCTGIGTFSTCNTAAYDTDLVVYDGCDCSALSLLGCNDDGAGCAGFTSIVSVNVVAGNCYLVRVGGWMDGDQGTGDLTISCAPACNWVCPPGSINENPVQACPVDGDDADLDPNGGCNSVPVSFDAIACGQTVCAQMSTYISSTGGQFRDTDWFMFEVVTADNYTLTCNGSASTLFGIVDDVVTCTAPAFIAFDTTAGNCDERSVTAFLQPGFYAAFGAPPVFTGVPCTSDYWLRLDCGSVVPDACCFPDGSCLDLLVPDCLAQGGTPQGPGTSCASIVCPPPPCDLVCVGTPEGEPCGTDTNGGCNSVPPIYGAIACGETVCGTSWAFAGTRDTDWYLLDVLDPDGNGFTEVSVEILSELPCIAWILSGPPIDCVNIVIEGTTGCSDGCVSLGLATACLPAPNTYVVWVGPGDCTGAGIFDGYPCNPGDVGNEYQITVSCVDCTPPAPPANDPCAGSLAIVDGPTAYDTSLATTDGLAHPTCQFDGQTYNDIWYDYIATCTGTLTVSTCGNAAYDTDLVVYDGCTICPNPDPPLGCNDDATGCPGFTSEVIVPVTAGNCYRVRVGGWNAGDAGTGTVTITCM